jgi:hypothetical protein
MNQKSFKRKTNLISTKVIQLIIFLTPIFLFSCAVTNDIENNQLEARKTANEDSTQWNKSLFLQDKETYTNHQDYLSNLPIHLTAFPVADYDYAVAGILISLNLKGKFTYGFSVGAYADSSDVEPTLEMGLFFTSPDSIIEENTFVQSRNYPNLTAQGMIKTNQKTYDWIFVQDSNQPGWVLVNMKLFQLQFGKTIIIEIQNDGSFFYRQLALDPTKYEDTESYKTALIQLL